MSMTANLCDYLLEGKPSTAIALLTLKGEHSYGELQTASRRIARFLVDAGAQKGERVLLIAENGLFWVAAYLGILRAGLVCVPLAPDLPTSDLEYLRQVTEPSFAFVEARYLPRLSSKLRGIPIVSDGSQPGSTDTHQTFNLTQGSIAEASSSAVLPEIKTDDLAALMFTSGSTGKPRGVMISHGNIIANTESIIAYLELTSGDRIMDVLPFHYCFGASLLHTHLRIGGSVVIDTRFMYPAKVLERMQETSCTGFAGVPSHFQILLRKSNLAKTQFPSLRYVQQAGGQLSPAFIEELQQALPGKDIFIMYGQTEATARLSYLPPDLLDKKLGSVGTGIPGVKLSVVDGFDRPVAPGHTGEIVAEGDNVTGGYWRDEEETRRTFRNGKLYTGDLATVDEEGFIYIVDRAKDFLKCGGTRISCRSVENVLLEHNQLLEAAVIGVPDDVLGEAAVAYVVSRSTLRPTSEDLSAHCRQRLPLPVVPKQFFFVNELPKGSSGKVLKAALKSSNVAVLSS